MDVIDMIRPKIEAVENSSKAMIRQTQFVGTLIQKSFGIKKYLDDIIDNPLEDKNEQYEREEDARLMWEDQQAAIEDQFLRALVLNEDAKRIGYNSLHDLYGEFLKAMQPIQANLGEEKPIQACDCS